MDAMLSTLCYIEQDGKYLMLHRVLKENDIDLTMQSISAESMRWTLYARVMKSILTVLRNMRNCS